jgi:transposase InsO family protein
LDIDKKNEIALFRFSLISSLIHLNDDEDMNNLLNSIEKKTFEIPFSKRKKINKKTILKYLSMYKKNGFNALLPKNRIDKDKPRNIKEPILSEIIKLKKEEPKRSVKQILYQLKLNPAFSDVNISIRTVSRLFNKLGLTKEKLLSNKKIFRRFEMEHINDLWEVDIMDGLFIKSNNKKSYLFAFIDDYSRIITHAQFYFNEKLPTLEDCLKKAILKRGIPKIIYADNGKIFVSNQLKRICAELGIKLLNHLPYSPQSKGKIERFFLRVQSEFLTEAKGADITTIEQLNTFFQAWLEVSYHRTKHNTTGETPIDRFVGDMKKVKIKKIETLEEITEIFLCREKRKITKTGMFALFQNHYKISDKSLLDKIVEVRYDGYDLSRVFVYDENGTFKQISFPVSFKNEKRLDIPEEIKRPESEIRKSSIDFFARLKQKEIEINKKESGFIDFTKFNEAKNDK